MIARAMPPGAGRMDATENQIQQGLQPRFQPEAPVEPSDGLAVVILPIQSAALSHESSSQTLFSVANGPRQIDKAIRVGWRGVTASFDIDGSRRKNKLIRGRFRIAHQLP